MEIAGLVLEGTVIVLLVATIVFCIILERRMRAFRADHEGFALLIGDLNEATRNAEKAVSGLKLTATEAEADLGDKLRRARALSDELTFMVDAGNSLAERLAGARAAEMPARPRDDRRQATRERSRLDDSVQEPVRRSPVQPKPERFERAAGRRQAQAPSPVEPEPRTSLRRPAWATAAHDRPAGTNRRAEVVDLEKRHRSRPAFDRPAPPSVPAREEALAEDRIPLARILRRAR